MDSSKPPVLRFGNQKNNVPDLEFFGEQPSTDNNNPALMPGNPFRDRKAAAPFTVGKREHLILLTTATALALPSPGAFLFKDRDTGVIM